MPEKQAWRRDKYSTAAAISSPSAAVIKFGIVFHKCAINSWEAHLCDFANLLCVFCFFFFPSSLFFCPAVSQEQYVFIHDAILEACLCGETAIPVNEFVLTYKEMLKVDSQSNTSPLREEFQVTLPTCDLPC